MLLYSVSAAVRPRMASMAALRRTELLLTKVIGGSKYMLDPVCKTTPPLLHLGFVGVLTSVPVALVIKRAGYTHTHTQFTN